MVRLNGVAGWLRYALCGVMLMAFSGVLATPVISQTTPVQVIQNDRGGYVGARAVEIAEINQRRTRVELRGRVCYSSCTMYLGADDLCVSPTTTFGFHGPSRNGAPLSPRQFEHWSEVMAQHYHGALRDWFMREARYRITGFFRISGATLIDMGYPGC